jgi:hypothetical protein
MASTSRLYNALNDFLHQCDIVWYDWSLLPQDLTMVVVPAPHPRDGLKVRFESVAAT